MYTRAPLVYVCAPMGTHATSVSTEGGPFNYWINNLTFLSLIWPILHGPNCIVNLNHCHHLQRFSIHHFLIHSIIAPNHRIEHDYVNLRFLLEIWQSYTRNLAWMMVWIPVFNRFQQRIIHFGNVLRDYPITLCIFLAIQWASSGSVPRLAL